MVVVDASLRVVGTRRGVAFLFGLGRFLSGGKHRRAKAFEWLTVGLRLEHVSWMEVDYVALYRWRSPAEELVRREEGEEDLAVSGVGRDHR